MSIRLHSYWRSSAAYRVRIALNLKGLAYEQTTWQLAQSQHLDARYNSINPQHLIPALEIDGQILTQSMAILEYLEAREPAPALLPKDLIERTKVRAFCQTIACDIHPLNNLRILKRLKQGPGKYSETETQEWIQHWITEGFVPLESWVRQHSRHAEFCWQQQCTLADVLLVPQIYNARRFNCSLDAFPTLVAITNSLVKHTAFQAAHPDVQPDAPPMA